MQIVTRRLNEFDFFVTTFIFVGNKDISYNFDNSSAVFVTSNADYNRYASNTVVTFLYNSFEIDIKYADFDISCGKRYNLSIHVDRCLIDSLVCLLFHSF